ncbi:hypothetical protein GCM10009801_75180 [Streptomyces albiaxialis]|uniref:Uncharacterized protein n=2 Tax=Streptomyces albiaxialis TaxID=329523 RepID=A0ABN2WZG6_9ACTN
MDDKAAQVLAGLPDDAAWHEVAELLADVRARPRAHPDVREIVGAEVREAFSAFGWVQYAVRDGAVAVRDIGWTG